MIERVFGAGFDQAPPGGADALAVMGLIPPVPSGAPIIPGTGFGSGFSTAPPMMGKPPVGVYIHMVAKGTVFSRFSR